MKIALSIILSVVMVICLQPISLIASAEEYTYGYYTYEIIDEEVTIFSVNPSISGNVIIPSTLGGYPVAYIGWLAFENCTAITSITIPSSVIYIDNESFRGCTGISNITVDDNNPIYLSKGNCIIEKETKEIIVGCKSSVIPTDGSVVGIGQNAFGGCSGLKSITIPDSVSSIGEYAFSDCEGLANISLHDNIEYLGGYAFFNTAYYNNENNWIDGILYIGNYLVETNGYAPTVCTIREGTIAILDYAFIYCEDITSIKIPNTVKSIGYEAFYGCIGLTSITIPNSVTNIERSAFQDCSELSTINIHDGITYIGEDAFSNTAYYNNSSNWINGVLYIGNYLVKANETVSGTITTRDGAITILDGAFSYCENLTSINIADSIKSVGDSVFEGCIGLTNVTIGNGVTSIGCYAFYDCTKLTNVIMGDNVKSIGEYAFSGCTELTAITIPKGVTSIGGCVFYYCSNLASITIPSSVINIGYEAFFGCDSLTDVYYGGSETDWSKIYIDDYNQSITNATIHYSLIEPTIVFGDVDSDKDIDATDALLVLQFSVDKIDFTEEQIIAGDVDGKVGVAATDALLVLQYSVNKINKFPIEE